MVTTQSAKIFEATIAAPRADGTVLLTDDGTTLLLPRSTDLREGARVIFAFEPSPATAGAARADTTFDVIDSILALLNGGGLNCTRSSIARLLPRPDKAMPALAAAFLSAVQGGDPTMWLGSGIMARLAGDHPLIHDRLTAAWSEARVAEDGTMGKWQMWTLPLLIESGLSPLGVYRRRGDDERKGHAGEGRGEATRVIFDCTFSRVGRVQVDALCRKPRRCDVVVRTAAPLEPTVRDALRLAYAETAATTGVVGNVGFQAAGKAFVEPGANSRPAEPLSLRV